MKTSPRNPVAITNNMLRSPLLLRRRSLSQARSLVCRQRVRPMTPLHCTGSCAAQSEKPFKNRRPHREYHSSARMLHTPIESMSWYNAGQYVMDMVHLTHDVTGASYATSICVVTILGRLALSPLIIKSLQNNSRRDELLPKLQELYRRKRATRQAVQDLYARYGYKPSQRYVLPVTTMAITVGMWYGLRWMGYYYPDEMSCGGLLWFVNLAEPDPLGFLPILSATSFFAMGELDADHMGRPMEQSVQMRWSLRGLRGAAFFVLIHVPASVHCFWIPNAFISIAQTIALSQSSVLTKMRIGPTKEKDEIVFIKDVLKEETSVIKQATNDGDLARGKRKEAVVGSARGKQGRARKGRKKH